MAWFDAYAHTGPRGIIVLSGCSIVVTALGSWFFVQCDDALASVLASLLPMLSFRASAFGVCEGAEEAGKGRRRQGPCKVARRPLVGKKSAGRAPERLLARTPGTCRCAVGGRAPAHAGRLRYHPSSCSAPSPPLSSVATISRSSARLRLRHSAGGGALLRGQRLFRPREDRSLHSLQSAAVRVCGLRLLFVLPGGCQRRAHAARPQHHRGHGLRSCWPWVRSSRRWRRIWSLP